MASRIPQRPQKTAPKAHPFFKLKAQTSSSSATESFNIHYQSAHAFYIKNDLAQSESAIDMALTLQPESIEALSFKAILCAKQNRTIDAERIWNKIIQHDPTQVSTLSNLGNLYRTEKRYVEAEQCLLKAIALSPNCFDALLNLGVVYYQLKQPEKALIYYNKAIAVNPTDAKLYFNKARLQQEYLDFEQAFITYRKALSCDPTYHDARANLLFLHYYCIPFDALQASEEARYLGHTLSRASNKYTEWECLSPEKRDRSLKVGLVSSDFRYHPVSLFLAPILPFIDSNTIELYAYANSIYSDEITDSLRPYFNSWTNIIHTGDESVAQLIHNDNIDILIDLTGQTAGNRLGVFAMKPAPIQVSWLGYFATTGLPEIDYVLADAICLPKEEEFLFNETVVRLPHSRLHLYRPEIVSQTPAPCTQGKSFTFGCFQNLAKINNDVLKVWAEILNRAPLARLHIQNGQLANGIVKKLFTQRLIAHNIDISRVSLFGSVPYKNFIEAHAEIDLLLDTFPYPGGTTTVESMWQGVPTLTLVTKGMLGRQGEQLLTAAGLTDWICHSHETYIQIATQYAIDAGHQKKLAELRHELAHKLKDSPAANAKVFAQDWSQILCSLWESRKNNFQ